MSLESLRAQIATVFQETFLFSCSIRDNIAYGVESDHDGADHPGGEAGKGA